MLVLGSPEHHMMQQSDTPSIQPFQHDNSAGRTNSRQAEGTTHPLHMIPGDQPHDQADTQAHSMGQFEPLSKDWSMYNSLAWPNATWESLFDLPSDFPYMDDTYEMG